MSVEVVVVEPTPEPSETPVAVVETVTPGELAARLEILEGRLNERITGVEVTAIDASVTAEQASESAEVASIIATVTAEQAVEPEAEEETPEVATAGDNAAEGGDEEDGVRAPERRDDKGVDTDTGGTHQRADKQSRTYGAGWLSGGR